VTLRTPADLRRCGGGHLWAARSSRRSRSDRRETQRPGAGTVPAPGCAVSRRAARRPSSTTGMARCGEQGLRPDGG